ncbi:MAG: hypothetical protein F7C82_02770 [Desulfurococcales archaeon]|nr:hypothetical protein [Desulfurococcales archaeon]MCE4626550.1 hypothetical protein [Desulfurococcales archaeon]MCE4629181.1 hypothetical protein [Desulfurococcales archaeon]
MDPYPLIVVIIPLMLSLSAASIYRSIYPYEQVKRAIDKMAEYRLMKSQMGTSKRARKKLKAMEAEYKRAKRTITRSIIVKMTLLLVSYMLGSILVFVYVPALPAPYSLPPLTVAAEGGYYIMSAILYFLVYVVVFLSLRDTFL